MAIRWARSTFLAVAGKKAPALTVASLAMIMCRRPATVPTPQTTPAAGRPPQSAYISHAGPQADFQPEAVRVQEQRDPLASGQPPFGVLAVDGRRPAPLLDRLGVDRQSLDRLGQGGTGMR